MAVQYQVNQDETSVMDAVYKLTNPRAQIESYVFDVLRSAVPKIELDDVFISKDDISSNIKKELSESMGSFGYSILASPITDIDPDAQVKRAMNEINKAPPRCATPSPPTPTVQKAPPHPPTRPQAKRMRLAANDEGEAVKIRAIKEAEAEANRTEIQAKADAEAKYLQGQGIARQRQAIVMGLRESVNSFKSEVEGVDAKQVMDLMLVTQYFDMMKDIGASSRTNAVFMNHSPGALEELTQSVQKGFMAGLPAAPGFAQQQRY